MQDYQENVENLIFAIVRQASNDYIQCKKNACQHGVMYGSTARLTDCVRFFRSRWFGFLTGLDGEEFMKKLDNQYKSWEREYVSELRGAGV